MNTHLILGIFIINWRIERGWDFEEKWPIHAQGPMKPVFGCALSVEGADVLFNNIDCIWPYTGSLFIDLIICLDRENTAIKMHKERNTIWGGHIVVDIRIDLLDYALEQGDKLSEYVLQSQSTQESDLQCFHIFRLNIWVLSTWYLLISDEFLSAQVTIENLRSENILMAQAAVSALLMSSFVSIHIIAWWFSLVSCSCCSFSASASASALAAAISSLVHHVLLAVVALGVFVWAWDERCAPGWEGFSAFLAFAGMVFTFFVGIACSVSGIAVLLASPWRLALLTVDLAFFAGAGSKSVTVMLSASQGHLDLLTVVFFAGASGPDSTTPISWALCECVALWAVVFVGAGFNSTTVSPTFIALWTVVLAFFTGAGGSDFMIAASSALQGHLRCSAALAGPFWVNTAMTDLAFVPTRWAFLQEEFQLEVPGMMMSRSQDLDMLLQVVNKTWG